MTTFLDGYAISTLVTLIGRAPDWSHFDPASGDEIIAQWYLDDGRIVSFTCLNGDNSFSVFQRKKAPGVSPEG